MLKWNKTLRPAIALILLLLATFGLMTAAQADTSDQYALTVVFDSTRCDVIVTYNGTPTPMLSEVPSYYPKNGTRVTLEIKPKAGYEFLYVKETGTESQLTGSNPYTFEISRDLSLTVSCDYKEYQILYLPDVNGFSFFTQGFPTTHTVAASTEIPSAPTREGFTFESWTLLTSPTATEGTTLMPDENGKVTLPANQRPADDTTFYLRPEWKAIQYPVYRYDYVYMPDGDHKGYRLTTAYSDTWMADYMSTVTGAMGSETVYPGYRYYGEYSTSITVGIPKPEEGFENAVYRFYLPNTYEIEYVAGYDGTLNFGEGVVAPTQHVYDQDTQIYDPIRTGYRFTGWSITVTKGGAPSVLSKTPGLVLGDRDESLAGDEGTKLTLTAEWEALEFAVEIDEGNGRPSYNLTSKYVYDQGIASIPAPTRTGYTFLGWKVNEEAALNTTGALPAFTYTADIKLVAQWEANKYTILLDGNGGDLGAVASLLAIYNELLDTTALKSALPTRTGYDFVGFTETPNGSDLIIDADGNYLGGIWTEEDPTTFYAKWQPRRYSVTVAISHATVYLNGVQYSGTPMEFDFGTPVRVKIVADKYYTVTVWNGAALTTPQAVLETSYTLPAENSTVTAEVRPMAPAYNADENGIRVVGIYPSDFSMAIRMAEYSFGFEFAWGADSTVNIADLDWVAAESLHKNSDGDYLIENLFPGTVYYIFIRVAETADTPCGVESMFEKSTNAINYRTQKIDELEDLKQQYGNGSRVNKLINDAIDAIKALEAPSADFYTSLEGIFNAASEQVKFAQKQDDRIRELEQLRNELIGDRVFDFYTSENETAINLFYNNAVAAIEAAETSDEINAAANDAIAGMKAVKISYLQDADGDLLITSQKGLPQGILLSHTPKELAQVLAAVNAAIQSGRVAVDNENPVQFADALESLRSLDLMAAYGVSLNLNNASYSSFDGLYTVRLTLSDDLVGVSGLQAAYLDAHGVLKVLKTELADDGKTLVFYTPELCEFVVLGDPTVNLSVVILSLAVILLCQLIAIGLLLVRRAKHARGVRHASVAWPILALSIRFLPDNALLLTAILGALVVLLQVVLMYLLLSSEVFRRRRHGVSSAPIAPVEVDEPIAATEAVEDMPVDEPSDITPTEDGDDSVMAMGYLEDEDSDYTDSEFDEEIDEEAEDPLLEEAEGVAEEANAEDEAEFDYFIEPAANPRYSIPDEGEALDEELTEDAEVEAEESEEAVLYGETDAYYGEDALPEEFICDAPSSYEADDEAAIEEAGEWVEEDEFEELPEQPMGEIPAATVFESDDDFSDILESESVDEEGEGTDLDEPAETEESIEAEEASKDTEEIEDESEMTDGYYFIPDARGETAPPPFYPGEE